MTYRARAMHPDYHTQLPGSRLSGPALEPYPFDGRLLGERHALVRAPLHEFTMFNGMLMGAVYHAPGITIGPGLVFAYAAVRDILGRALPGAEATRTLTGWSQ
ncbi:hypothetical protein [Brevibacterium marinum]|uniref:Uncharacterized protein n=1 Tax=Brevibacterium marinum TaxID=418643 RepID=A0A846S6K3_9MICO|nr:hypothetical protein [Brevibacterium marinum]NJC57072.1 hypothetical protein [Brevibacterium marinum]